MKTKIQVLVALGLGVQGAVSSLKNPTWPLFAATSSDATYLSPKLNSKGYGCTRNAFYWTFPQTITTNVVAAQGGSGRTFYASSTAMLGTSPTADGAVPAQSNTVACCVVGMTKDTCLTASWNNGGVDTPIPHKMIWGQPSTGVATTSWEIPGAALSPSTALNLPRVHTDLAVASTNQLSWDGVTGTRAAATGDYCDKQVHHATAATETYTFSTIAGLVGTTKCTYIFTVAAGIGAPAFKLASADFMQFQLHFFEWSADGTNIKQIPATSTTPSFYGAYPTHFYPSPIVDSGTTTAGQAYPSSGTAINWIQAKCGDTPTTIPFGYAAVQQNNCYDTFTDPTKLIPGDIGPMNFYIPGDGPFKGRPGTVTDANGVAGAGYVNINSGIILEDWKRQNDTITTYYAQKAQYDMVKDIYDTARASENKRNSDWFKKWFAPPAQVPVRPCPVKQPILVSASRMKTSAPITQESQLQYAVTPAPTPATYDGVKPFMAPFTIPIISWGLSTADTVAKLEAAGTPQDSLRGRSWSDFENGQLVNSGVAGNWMQSAWLQASRDDTAATTETKAAAIEYVEHVFGKFGQGIGANVTDNYAFSMEANTATYSHGVMFSIFPQAIDTTGLTSTNVITITGSIRPFYASNTVLGPPERPLACTDPSPAKASTLAAGTLLSLAIIASSLY